MAHDIVLQKPTSTVCFYVRPRHADTEYYRAIYLKERTMCALINGISEKFKVGLASVGQITYYDSKFAQVVIDEDALDRVEDGQNMAVELVSTEHNHQSPLVGPLFNIVRDDINLPRPHPSTSASQWPGEDIHFDEFADLIALFTEEDIDFANNSLHNAEVLTNNPRNIRDAMSAGPPSSKTSPQLLEGIQDSTRSASDSSFKPQSEETQAKALGTIAEATGNSARSYEKPKKSASCPMYSSLTVNMRVLPQPEKSPVAASVASPPTNCYIDSFLSMECNENDFGFDPPTSTSAYSTFDLSSGSKNRNDMAMPVARPNSEAERESKGNTSTKFGIKPCSINVSRKLDNTQAKESLSVSTTVSGFGLVDLPRSVRKRKKSRKSAASVADLNSTVKDKRRISLEKNRVAAAKCRISKKEKIEQMQDDSRKKAVQNAFLRHTTMQLEKEIEYMNRLVLVHSDCKDCDKPEEVQKYIQRNEQQIPLACKWPAP